MLHLVPVHHDLLAKCSHHRPDAHALPSRADRASWKRREALQGLRGVVRQRAPKREDRASADSGHDPVTTSSLRRHLCHLDSATRQEIISTFQMRFTAELKNLALSNAI